ncbi:hypothetical protein B0H13DRAFT_1857161 [Mycena leptocephala]|nr:hypothetical protein B0H13DRAFT_1857161 [Mycena leptocephala]
MWIYVHTIPSTHKTVPVFLGIFCSLQCEQYYWTKHEQRKFPQNLLGAAGGYVGLCICSAWRIWKMEDRPNFRAVVQWVSENDLDLLAKLTRRALSNPKLSSILHYVECVPGTVWPATVPARGQRLRPRGVARVVGPCELPGADFDSPLGLEQILPVYAAPWNAPLPVTTIVLSKEDALKALAVALEDARWCQSMWFTDGSLLEGRAGGAAVRVEGGREMERIVVPLGRGQVCEGEMEGLVRGTTKAILDACACVLAPIS